MADKFPIRHYAADEVEPGSPAQLGEFAPGDTVPVSSGGTGQETWPSGSIPYAAGLDDLEPLTIGLLGDVLQSDSLTPVWGKITNSNVAALAAIAWSKVDKTGSSLADLTVRSAGDLSSGTLLSARLSGSYTGITGVGTLAVGTWQGSSISTTYTDAKVVSISGTTNRITVGGTANNPTVDIAATYVGQTSLVTLGTVTTGTWNATSIGTAYTDAKVVSISGVTNRTTISGTTTVPIVDISASYAGQSTIVTLGTVTTGVWQGTQIVDTYLATISTAGKVSNSATTATATNTVSTIVARDGSGNFSAGTITATLTGNAATATALQTARNINGVSFNGTADITVTAAAGTLTGTTLNSTVVTSSLTSVGTLTALTVSGELQDTSRIYVSGNGNGSGYYLAGDVLYYGRFWHEASEDRWRLGYASGRGTAGTTVISYSATDVTISQPLSATLSTAAQPNITSVGTLTSLTVSTAFGINSSGKYAVASFNPDSDNTRTLGGSGAEWAQVWSRLLIQNGTTVLNNGAANLVSAVVRGTGTTLGTANVNTTLAETATVTNRGVYLGYDATSNAGVLAPSGATTTEQNLSIWTFNGSAWGERWKYTAAGNLVSAGGNLTGAGTVSATTLTGTLSTAAQTNITSVGTLTTLTVSGATNLLGIVKLADSSISSTGALAGDLLTYQDRYFRGMKSGNTGSWPLIGYSSGEYVDIDPSARGSKMTGALTVTGAVIASGTFAAGSGSNFSLDSTGRFNASNAAFKPAADATYELGASGAEWLHVRTRQLYVNGSLGIDNAAGALIFGGTIGTDIVVSSANRLMMGYITTTGLSAQDIGLTAGSSLKGRNNAQNNHYSLIKLSSDAVSIDADARGTTFGAGVTLTGGLSGVTTLSMSSTLTMTASASKIVPGATSFSHRNNADTADNLLITDAGVVTTRSHLIIPSGSKFLIDGSSAGDTYVIESAANRMSFFAGGGEYFQVDATTKATSTSDLLLSTNNTYLRGKTTTAALKNIIGIDNTAPGLVYIDSDALGTKFGGSVTAPRAWQFNNSSVNSTNNSNAATVNPVTGVAILASESWVCSYAIFMDPGANTGGYKLKLTAPTGATVKAYASGNTTGVAVNTYEQITAVGEFATTWGAYAGKSSVYVDVYVVNSTNAGNITLEYRPVTNLQTMTVLPGSYVRANRAA